MTDSTTKPFLVISRGQWDPAADKDEIEAAIGKFYQWYEAAVAAGRMQAGSRLTTEGAQVTKTGMVTDGPFGEGKEVIGGYWFIIARDLAEAARIASENPVLPFGIDLEIRPLEAERGSVFRRTNETPTL
jgi:hypothetical protein